MEAQAFIIARVLHMLGVVLWIGGVAMVTTVLLPAIAETVAASERIAVFDRIERRFAWQARLTTLVVGLSGGYMLYVLHAGERFAYLQYWWMHAMVLVWTVFTVMLFVLEPLMLHRKLSEMASRDPVATYRLIQRLHWGLLTVSLITGAGAVAGSHGWSF